MKADEVIITKLDRVYTVFSEKGRVFKMKDRSSWGISLCTEGKIIYEIDGKRIVSEPGTAILLGKNASYTLYGEREGTFPLINFQCYGLPYGDICSFPVKSQKICTNLFESIQSMLLFQGSQLRIYSAFYELLDQILGIESSKDEWFSAILQFVEKKISDPALTNRFIASNFGVSEVYLRKIFQSHLQLSPKQYVLNLRIRMAKNMLREGIFSITEISEQCGFSTLYHFSKTFRERVGISPMQYMKENKTIGL